MGEERLVRLDLRLGSRRDRWRKYIKGTMESLRSESGYQWGLGDLGARNEENKGGDWKTMVGRREEQLWREGMEKSQGSLEVYREVVKRRGEMKEWKGLVEETKVWWRRFRGGMLIGKRRENKWSDERCIFCGGEWRSEACCVGM